jgi:D-glycero-D-manno-heptose 1,7-bisphosphate phosphatase
MSKNKAAFFDRDGTIIKDVGYLSNLSQIEMLPGVVPLCHFLQKEGYKLFVITNQSGVARGFFDENSVQATHEHLKKIFKDLGVDFQKFYYCPHHPTKATKTEYLRSCFCRKPNPGMLLQAAQEFDIDLKSSLMFGDKLIDMEVGIAAGCKSFFIQQFLSFEPAQKDFGKNFESTIKEFSYE